MGQSAWSVRLMGDQTEYSNANSTKPQVSNGVVVVRSLQWPGAYSFYYNGEVSSVYVGNGHKYQ